MNPKHIPVQLVKVEMLVVGQLGFEVLLGYYDNLDTTIITHRKEKKKYIYLFFISLIALLVYSRAAWVSTQKYIN